MTDKIFDTIENDLSGYGQDNIAPNSITFGSGKDWRHYELGPIFGLVAYGEGHVMITEIREDDEYWYCFNDTDKDRYGANWIKTKIKLYQRMQKWLDSNLTRGYFSGFEGQKGYECGYVNLKNK